MPQYSLELSVFESLLCTPYCFFIISAFRTLDPFFNTASTSSIDDQKYLPASLFSYLLRETEARAYLLHGHLLPYRRILIQRIPCRNNITLVVENKHILIYLSPVTFYHTTTTCHI